jgi:hypothetical protein
MLGARTWRSLEIAGAVNINKFRLVSGAKLRFGFVQAIPDYKGYLLGKVLCFLFYAGPLAF